MRKIIGLVLASALALAMFAVAADAHTTNVHGTVRGTGTLTFSCTGGDAHQVLDVTLKRPGLQAWTMHLDGCIQFATPCTYGGNLSIATVKAKVSGTFSGSMTCAGNGPYALSVHLSVTGGTREYAHATGAIDVKATVDLDHTTFNETVRNGTATGSISY